MKRAEKQALAEAGRHLSEDFRLFCEYVLEHQVTVPQATAALGKKDCFELNKQMFFKENYEKAGHLISRYALLHFFQYAAARYGVLALTHKTKSRLQYQRGRAYQAFWQLSAPAQYLLLFLCFSYEYISALKQEIWYEDMWLEQFFELLTATGAGAEITAIPEQRWILRMEFYEYSHILRFMHECGLCEVEFYTPEEEKRAERGGISVQSFSTKVKRMTVTAAGAIMGDWFISGFQRVAWLREQPGGEQLLRPEARLGTVSSIYVKDFVPEEWFLIQQVLEPEAQEQTGVYEFLVKLGKCERTIWLNGDRTLARLHTEIQEAFRFDNDHLYYFSLGYGLMERKYYSPHMGDQEYLADEVQLQQLDLEAGDRFTYLFDFGDCWQFDITVMRTMSGSAQKEGCIAAKNAPPSQYGYGAAPWDEDEFPEDEEWEAEEAAYQVVPARVVVRKEAETAAEQAAAEHLSPDQLIQDFYERYPDAGMLAEQYLSTAGRLENQQQALRRKLQRDIDMQAGTDGVQMSLDLFTGAIQDDTPAKAEGFRICRMPGTWSDALAVNTIPELKAMHEKIGVRCMSVGSKEQLQQSLAWHFASSAAWMDRLLDEEARDTLRYLYDQEGRNTDRRLAYEPLAKLLALGLIEIRFPKPRWKQECLPAVVFLEEGKELLDDKL